MTEAWEARRFAPDRGEIKQWLKIEERKKVDRAYECPLFIIFCWFHRQAPDTEFSVFGYAHLILLLSVQSGRKKTFASQVRSRTAEHALISQVTCCLVDSVL